MLRKVSGIRRINKLKVRNERGLSQEKLAERCNISNTTLSMYENSKKIPSLSTIAKIAKSLGVSIERLYYGDENSSFINSEPDLGKKLLILYIFYGRLE